MFNNLIKTIMKKNLWYLNAIMLVAMSNFVVTSCSSGDEDDDDGVSTSPITISAGDKTVITGAESITSLNEFVAYVNNDLSVTGYHVGETTLTVNQKKNIKITVSPKSTLYDDPVTKWGCDQSYVKSSQKQGSLSSKSDSKNLIYENVGKANAILMYTFDSGKMKSVGAVVSTAYTSEYATYLSERFLMLPYETAKDTYFIGVDALEKDKANTYVVLQVYDYKTLIAVYMSPSSVNKTRSEFDLRNEVEKVKKEMSRFLSSQSV